jgi:hypothetical protein
MEMVGFGTMVDKLGRSGGMLSLSPLAGLELNPDLKPGAHAPCYFSIGPPGLHLMVFDTMPK